MGISNKTRLGIIELQTNHKISTVLAGRTTTFLSCYQAIEGDDLIFQQAGKHVVLLPIFPIYYCWQEGFL